PAPPPAHPHRSPTRPPVPINFPATIPRPPPSTLFPYTTLFRSSDLGYGLADTDTSPDTTQSFSYAAAQGEGTYSFYTRAFDKAGDRKSTPLAPSHRQTAHSDTTATETTDNAPAGWQNSDVTVTL